jgi:D-alanyl-D-alanine carboxypeptidase/D-alanyl-D-alanine-endopeptidase (penicillin-binding protein 4)
MVIKSAFRIFVRFSTALLIAVLHWGAVAAGATSAGSAGAPIDGSRVTAIPAPVADALRAAGIPIGGLGLVVRPLDGRGPVLEYQASRPFNPASTMKLVTTYAALGVLGVDYRWRTTFHAGGPVVGDRLRGDLILRGGGDPKLVVEDLTELIARVRATGIRQIDGDLVLDDGLYQDDPAEAASDAREFDSTQPWAVRPSAALLNFRAVGITATAGAGSDSARISLDPPLTGVDMTGRVIVRPGPCREAPLLDARWLSDGASLRVEGRMASGCGETSTWIAGPAPARYARLLFGSLWEASGGTLTGAARIVPGAAQGRPVLAEWVSPRNLADVVRDANKFSNNVMTRQLLLQVGANRLGVPGTTQKGAQAIAEWLAGRGVGLPDLILENGSGLSRNERISADSLARLLVHAAADASLGPIFVESLPLAGVDGTMKRRLQGEPITGQASIKTGSANEVRSMAGYVQSASGRRWAVVMLVNGPGAQASTPAQDRLLRWVHSQL